ncbi:hypothetical protein NKR23_g1138 [Pleurostoma richardsiae]|uniref:Uncharacterized protein n=1 Tax=Pleurostoma richardsiae TaxID=41990 RepID=A0AA38S5F0_9PEZI|nr:hypothetical protein NKR23_g1138 [Pleurostoma richardsiae]
MPRTAYFTRQTLYQRALLTAERIAAGLNGKYCPTGEDAVDAFSRTLVADMPLLEGVSHREVYRAVRGKCSSCRTGIGVRMNTQRCAT